MLWIRTNDTDDTVSFDNLTLIADGLYAGSYFHKSPPGDRYTLLESWQFAMNYNSSPMSITKYPNLFYSKTKKFDKNSSNLHNFS